MANTQAMLATAVAGFMQRDASVFVRGTTPNTFDLLLQACNNARLYAERKVDFELSVAQVTIPAVSLLNGASLSTAVLYGTLTPASVKKIRTPFLSMANNAQYPVDLWSKKKWNDRLKARYEGARPTDTSDYAFITESPFVVVQNGYTIFVAPADSTAFSGTFPIYLDCWLWLPPYVLGTESDFLLVNCFDWLMYRCIYELNFFLKEDERVILSDKLMNEAWLALVEWNNQLIASAVDDVDLD